MSMPEESESGASPVTLTDVEDPVADPAAGRGPGRLASGRRRWRWRLAWPASLVAAAVGLDICYLFVSNTYPVASDGASNALQAWDMLHGNVLLSGWLLGHVSFYTTELPEYVIVEAIRGLNADVLHISAAITYTLLVLLAALLARGRTKGREGVLRALVAAGIMIAPQLGPGVFILVSQPDHVGTQVPLLVTWLVLDRAQCLPGGTTPRVPPAKGLPGGTTPRVPPSRRWWVPVVVGLMLAWTEVADGFALLVAAVPLGAVAIVRSYRALVQRREPLRSAWFDLSLIAAAVLSAVLTGLVVKLVGYSVLAVPTGLATAAELPGHLWLLAEGVLGLFGADFLGLPLGLTAAIAFLHLIGLLLAAVALWRVIKRFFPCDDLVDQVLATSVVLTMVAYVMSTIPLTYYSARYLAGVLVGGAVLAGRTLARPMMKARLVPAMSLVLACYLAALGFSAAQNAVAADGQDLADWLTAHHLSYGLTGYGLANTTTLASRGAVHLLPVAWTGPDVSPGPSGFKQSWYDPQAHDANFVVLLAAPGPLDEITGSQVAGTFGPPRHVYSYDGYVIATYDINLLTNLSP